MPYGIKGAYSWRLNSNTDAQFGALTHRMRLLLSGKNWKRRMKPLSNTVKSLGKLKATRKECGHPIPRWSFCEHLDGSNTYFFKSCMKIVSSRVTMRLRGSLSIRNWRSPES